MSSWIYESQDGGKTITRRRSGAPDDTREMEVWKDQWYSLKRLRELGEVHAFETAMRQRYPQLMEMWESYQTMLALLKEERYEIQP